MQNNNNIFASTPFHLNKALINGIAACPICHKQQVIYVVYYAENMEGVTDNQRATCKACGSYFNVCPVKPVKPVY